ncbi:hypothetical protein [Nocardioides sp.]|uniref:hypothetical protein n=1 Tax=Nocardioides sp. TaxID=35761 RepID=UPI002BB7D3CB|nr:hypothetical protein [Nocardioides sp.]HXH78765.1 hypothetical protein [Nocardioides sp.]
MRPEGREVDQVSWRLAIVLLLVALASIPLSTLLQDSWTTHPSAEDIAEAKEIVAAGRLDQLEEMERCKTDPGYDGGQPMDAAECEEMFTWHYEEFLEPPAIDFDLVRRDFTAASVTLLVILMMLIGSTFMRHEWGMAYRGKRLVVERRRLRQWFAKALAVTAATTVAGIVVLSRGPSCPEVYIPEDYEAANCTRQLVTWDGEPFLGVILGAAVVLLTWMSKRRDVS